MSLCCHTGLNPTTSKFAGHHTAARMSYEIVKCFEGVKKCYINAIYYYYY